MRKKSFDSVFLADLRHIPIQELLTKLGLYCKIDTDFLSIKNKNTKRLHISVGNSVFEIIITGQKWYDQRQAKGGGGCIDLVMHILKLPFVKAVKKIKSVYQIP